MNMDNIYEIMNNIDDNASLTTGNKNPMNEIFGIGKKSYYVSILKTKGIDPESLENEVTIAISRNKGKLDKHTYPDKFPSAYVTLKFEADDKSREKIQDACDQIQYDDVRDTKYDLSAMNKRPEEINKLIRSSIKWLDEE